MLNLAEIFMSRGNSSSFSKDEEFRSIAFDQSQN